MWMPTNLFFVPLCLLPKSFPRLPSLSFPLSSRGTRGVSHRIKTCFRLLRAFCLPPFARRRNLLLSLHSGLIENEKAESSARYRRRLWRVKLAICDKAWRIQFNWLKVEVSFRAVPWGKSSRHCLADIPRDCFRLTVGKGRRSGGEKGKQIRWHYRKCGLRGRKNNTKQSTRWSFLPGTSIIKSKCVSKLFYILRYGHGTRAREEIKNNPNKIWFLCQLRFSRLPRYLPNDKHLACQGRDADGRGSPGAKWGRMSMNLSEDFLCLSDSEVNSWWQTLNPSYSTSEPPHRLNKLLKWRFFWFDIALKWGKSITQKRPSSRRKLLKVNSGVFFSLSGQNPASLLSPLPPRTPPQVNKPQSTCVCV